MPLCVRKAQSLLTQVALPHNLMTAKFYSVDVLVRYTNQNCRHVHARACQHAIGIQEIPGVMQEKLTAEPQNAGARTGPLFVNPLLKRLKGQGV